MNVHAKGLWLSGRTLYGGKLLNGWHKKKAAHNVRLLLCGVTILGQIGDNKSCVLFSCCSLQSTSGSDEVIITLLEAASFHRDKLMHRRCIKLFFCSISLISTFFYCYWYSFVPFILGLVAFYSHQWLIHWTLIKRDLTVSIKTQFIATRCTHAHKCTLKFRI